MSDDPRVVDSTGALVLGHESKSMLILGGGIIGLMQGADRDLVKVWQKMNAPRFDNILLKTKTVAAKSTPARK